MKVYLKALFLFLVASMTATYDVLAQCAMCRATVENNVSYGETSVASGLNFGIIYLFVTPYLLFMVLAYFWYKKSRQQKKKLRIQKHF